VPALRRVSQKHRDLSVLDPSGSAGVLPLHPDRAGTFLQETCLVDDQDPTRITEMLADIATDVIAHRVGVPAGFTQQPL
jgi:hypothetical protein